MQPPSGGCVLKLSKNRILLQQTQQPPSGGCVLKHYLLLGVKGINLWQPPSGGCVLKLVKGVQIFKKVCSHLRVAVC